MPLNAFPCLRDYFATCSKWTSLVYGGVLRFGPLEANEGNKVKYSGLNAQRNAVCKLQQLVRGTLKSGSKIYRILLEEKLCYCILKMDNRFDILKRKSHLKKMLHGHVCGFQAKYNTVQRF